MIRMLKKNFQQINEANEVLSDPEKRNKYDQYGNDWQHAEQFEKTSISTSGKTKLAIDNMVMVVRYY